MTSHERNPSRSAEPSAGSGALAPRSRGLTLALVPVLVILVTYLFWYSTWFGRRLSKSEMSEYLGDTSVPHKTQHALSQLAGEIARGDPEAKHWYPLVIRLAGDTEPQLRLTAAWVMGQDNQAPEFHFALLKLVRDPVAMVRWNAALALSRFGDATGEPQLRPMLEPYTLLAPGPGTVTFSSKEQDPVSPGTIVARVADGSAAFEVRSPLSGRVERRMATEGARVQAGDEIAVLLPGNQQVLQALRALSIVGAPGDLEGVERLARGDSGMPDAVRQQAVATERAIRNREQGSKDRGERPERKKP